MSQKKIMIFLYFLHYYLNDAFYKPTIPSFFHIKNDLHHLLNSNNNDFENNDLEINSTSKLFNKNIRLGRSKDEDGVGNIWSVEPKMEVINEEITELNKNIVTCGLIITGILTSLPLLYTFNQYIQNIDY